MVAFISWDFCDFGNHQLWGNGQSDMPEEIEMRSCCLHSQTGLQAKTMSNINLSPVYLSESMDLAEKLSQISIKLSNNLPKQFEHDNNCAVVNLHSKRYQVYSGIFSQCHYYNSIDQLQDKNSM